MDILQIRDVFNCNRIIFKLTEQQSQFPIDVGFRLFKISKIFDEVEEFVFNLMNITFNDFQFEEMTDEQKMFFEKVMTQQIELEYDKIPLSVFENNDKLKLTIEEIGYLSIILK